MPTFDWNRSRELEAYYYEQSHSGNRVVGLSLNMGRYPSVAQPDRCEVYDNTTKRGRPSCHVGGPSPTVEGPGWTLSAGNLRRYLPYTCEDGCATTVVLAFAGPEVVGWWDGARNPSHFTFVTE